jgi:hypothetical protein
MDSISILGDCAKKCQQAFLAPLPKMDSISILGDCAKKCQQQTSRVTRIPPAQRALLVPQDARKVSNALEALQISLK